MTNSSPRWSLYSITEIHWTVARWLVALLVPLLLASSPSVAQDSKEARKVASRLADAFEKEDWPKAVQLGKKLVELQPKNHVAPYNLACAYARNGQVEEALIWLERSAAEGFSNPEGVLEDEDLASLRQEARFARAVKQIQANYDRARALFAEIAEGSEALIVAPPLDEGREGEALPVLLLLHGYGDSTESFLRYFEDFGRREGLLLVGVRSVVPAPGNPPGQRFEWANPVDTQLQIRSALAQASARHRLDESRIYLLGFSQGGRMALEAATVEDAPYRGVVAVGSRVRSDLQEALPGDAPPMTLMVGGEDGPALSVRRGAKALKKAGHRVDFRLYPGVGHAFPRGWESEVRRAIRWFNSFP